MATLAKGNTLSMRILHTSDWHLGKTLHEHSLLEEQQAFLDQLLEFLQREKHDALVVAGDIYDRSVPPREAILLLSKFLSDLRSLSSIPVLIIPGNHDSASRLSYLSQLIKDQDIHFLADLDQIHEPVRIGPADFFGIPFLSPYDMDLEILPEEHRQRTHENALRAALARIQLNPSRINVLIAHLFATGGSTSDSERAFVGASGEVDVNLLKDFDYVALGHLHRPQKPAANAHYSGSPLAYSFSESSDQKCFLSVTLADSADSSAPSGSHSAPVSTPNMVDVRQAGNPGRRKSRKSHHSDAQLELLGEKTTAKDSAIPADHSDSRADRPGDISPPETIDPPGDGRLRDVQRIAIRPRRPVSMISGYYDDLLKSPEFEVYKGHYLEIELLDHTFVGSPMRSLGKRFPFLLSIKREMKSVQNHSDSFPERKGKSIEDDFLSFQSYLYGAEDNELLDAKKRLFERELVRSESADSGSPGQFEAGGNASDSHTGAQEPAAGPKNAAIESGRVGSAEEQSADEGDASGQKMTPTNAVGTKQTAKKKTAGKKSAKKKSAKKGGSK
tara:strand:+ start:61496 stop:63172 length:1677 start_codon:yes stop_codon:yes gene_type:complete